MTLNILLLSADSCSRRLGEVSPMQWCHLIKEAISKSLTLIGTCLHSVLQKRHT